MRACLCILHYVSIQTIEELVGQYVPLVCFDEEASTAFFTWKILKHEYSCSDVQESLPLAFLIN